MSTATTKGSGRNKKAHGVEVVSDTDGVGGDQGGLTAQVPTKERREVEVRVWVQT